MSKRTLEDTEDMDSNDNEDSNENGLISESQSNEGTDLSNTEEPVQGFMEIMSRYRDRPIEELTSLETQREILGQLFPQAQSNDNNVTAQDSGATEMHAASNEDETNTAVTTELPPGWTEGVASDGRVFFIF